MTPRLLLEVQQHLGVGSFEQPKTIDLILSLMRDGCMAHPRVGVDPGSA
jgi:hypothetical protein